MSTKAGCQLDGEDWNQLNIPAILDRMADSDWIVIDWTV